MTYVATTQAHEVKSQPSSVSNLDAKALCRKLDRFVQGNRDALAIVRVPSEQEERSRAIHRQREQLVGARKRLEAQGRSLMVNHGIEPVQNLVEAAHFCRARCAAVDERAASKQPTDLARIAAKDCCPHNPIAK